MNRRLVVALIGGPALVAATGLLIATAQPRGGHEMSGHSTTTNRTGILLVVGMILAAAVSTEAQRRRRKRPGRRASMTECSAMPEAAGR